MEQKQPFRAVISGISVPYTAGEDVMIQKAEEKMKRVGIPTAPLHFRLYKRSVDARKKGDIRFAVSVLAEGECAADDKTLAAADAKRLTAGVLPRETPHGQEKLGAAPLVVGMGPAGLFAALVLAESGYAPVLIDRGEDVFARAKTVERFYETGVLNPESNVQFGAGGAGTFSDGKLMTRIHDPLCSYVLETLHRFGAPDDVLTQAKPHIGTDVLRVVVDNLLQKIEALGGQVRYRTRLDRLERLPDGTYRAGTSAGDIHAGCVVLALGNAARDTFETLLRDGYAVEPKPMSVGVRIEHLQSDIDRALYGDAAGDPRLGHAEYALSDTTGARGVYTFCMCPGGEVVAGASEEGRLVVNGMSRHARDGKNANCAVAVSLGVSDYDTENGAVAGAIALQRRIEEAAYRVGGGGFTAPVQTVGDFLAGKVGTAPSRIQPTYRGGICRPADLHMVFPNDVGRELERALRSFDRKIHGFACADAVLTAAETRTSSPVRILRDEHMTAVGNDRVYPCGEGAGYAGGITSSAVDGVRAAKAVLERFCPLGNA